MCIITAKLTAWFIDSSHCVVVGCMFVRSFLIEDKNYILHCLSVSAGQTAKIFSRALGKVELDLELWPINVPTTTSSLGT